jgi:outer membrane protein assembly factor BamB
VYTFGATGILNVLDARDGTIVWSRNAASDTDTEIPIWGFSSSPLVVENVVIVAAASSLIAYDITTGDPRWFRKIGSVCYSSPHLLTIDGVTQIVMLNETGASGFTPADGTVLWKLPWPGGPIVQPALTMEGDILITLSERSGICRIAVLQGARGWTIKERWKSKRLKPYFNDCVVHEGHVYGLNGRRLTCIDLDDGARLWRGRGYGGQIILLADQDVLLILSEKGELVLVKATPEQFVELARFPAIKGKTWNHPVLIGDILLVRNAQEMAAFRLTLAGH